MKTFGDVYGLATKTAFDVLLLLGIAIIAGAHNSLNAQQKGAEVAAQKPKADYSLVVKAGPPTSVSIKAKEISLSRIAADLSTRLKAPVKLSPLLAEQKVSVNSSDLTLEMALQMLAPQVFIDYRVIDNVQTPIGIYLYGYNEPQPSFTEVVKGASEAILFEGDTEEGVEPTSAEAKKRIEESPLRISFDGNRLTVRARKQPLVLIVLRIGSELGVPVELRDEPAELVTTEIVGIPTEEAIQRLSSSIAMYVRADLQRLERRLLRLIIMPPANQTHSNAVP